jgi:hypothetical protein
MAGTLNGAGQQKARPIDNLRDDRLPHAATGAQHAHLDVLLRHVVNVGDASAACNWLHSWAGRAMV